ncbi:superkiller protein 3 [[Candida] jaroonii]|uniref:Superkiller protein 3 n=1 Tax=[Candida] jaroonii TaxID=467808 RepID=A0ACA9Y0N7_9ASCO|nr:superkiller protein 3 [[Candida] jaroonii]
MSNATAKHYLKLAKGAIESNDPELALEYVEDVLEADKNNYFAFIFRGKSYQLLKKPQEAAKAFEKAVSIDEDNLLGWRGYFQLVRTTDDYELFFEVLADYLSKLLDQQQSLIEALDDASKYLNAHEYKKNPELTEIYLKNVIPGSEIYELVHNHFGKGDENLKNLVDLLLKKEDDSINKILFKERMRLPKVLNHEQRVKLNQLIWPVYENSQLISYFDQFLSICDDKDLRVEYQEKYLKYKYEVLKTAPEDEKDQYFGDVKSMVEDLVIIKVPSLFIWSLYLDLIDIRNFHDLSKEDVLFVINNFSTEGLGILLYGFLNSEISPFDKTVLKQVKFEPKPETVKDEDDEDEVIDESLLDDEPNSTELQPEDVLSLMLEGFEKCKDSILANRIIINYYITVREYLQASDRCKNGIKMLADLQRSISANLSNSREDLICSLAVAYTYHEAPKNFSRALELYDKVLQNTSTNKRARIGKGLILMEKGDLNTASQLLNEVYKEYPEDPDVLMELGWCEVQLSNNDFGNELLSKALLRINGLDIQSFELRAKINWRLATSYMKSDYQKSYDLLINSLKEFKNFAPSYTLLGLIYINHYQDKVRSQKCFYKAFELDVSEVVSARYLVEELTAKNEWEIAEILCTKVVESDRSRRSLSVQEDKSWPYRVLGCSALNRQDDGKAVEWFQTALRMSSMDFECWVGLGEAYYNCGRLDAAQKVFERALSIQDSWIVVYMLGRVLCDTKEFETGIQQLKNALQQKPNEECILNSLFQAHLEYIKRLMDGGFFGKVIEINNENIKIIKQASVDYYKSPSLWLSLNKSLHIFLKIQTNLENFPIEDVIEIFESVKDTQQEAFLVEINELDENLNLSTATELFHKGKRVESIMSLIILSCKNPIDLFPNEGRYIRSINYYNLGLSYYEAFNITQDTKFRDCAIKSLKKAIQLEGKNPSFWVALGNVYSSFNPRIAQHCFIKAIAFESRDGDIWNNLAALYLKYGDTELAQEAYLRSQSVAPEQSQPWLGHALTAKAKGETDKAYNLFTHAYILSNGKSPLAQLLYALNVINKRINDNSGSDPRDIETAQEFSIGNFAIQNYLRYYPNDKLGLKIALTISERCKNFSKAKEIGEKLLTILEGEYEENEDLKTLDEFIGVKCQISRIYLAVGDYDKAIEESELALALCEEDNSTHKKYLLSSQVTIGLAYFFQNNLSKSLDQLKTILGEYNNSQTIISLTAQILNGFNTEDTKQAALDQLFTYIEENGSSLSIVLTLGAISLKDELMDYLPAVKDELLQLSLDEILKDSFRSIPRLLDEIDKRLQKSNNNIWLKNAILFPNDYHVWKHINSKMALSIANLKETKLTSSDVSNALLTNGGTRGIQRGIILAPQEFNWPFTV